MLTAKSTSLLSESKSKLTSLLKLKLKIDILTD